MGSTGGSRCFPWSCTAASENALRTHRNHPDWQEGSVPPGGNELRPFRQPAVINKPLTRSSVQQGIKEEWLQSYRVLVQGTHGGHSITKPSQQLHHTLSYLGQMATAYTFREGFYDTKSSLPLDGFILTGTCMARQYLKS